MWINDRLQLQRDMRIKYRRPRHIACRRFRRELGMKKAVKPRYWNKPEIRRLGKISDVAGAQGAGAQGAGTKT